MFRVLSDLHLEFYHKRRDGVKALLDTIPWTDADKDTNLLLAGDVGWCVRPGRINAFSESARALLDGNETVLERLARAEDSLPGFVCKSFVRLLSELRSRFRSVTFVPGNHEYYVCIDKDSGDRVISPSLVDSVLRALCLRTGVTFLQKGETRIDGVRVLGCTLWAPYKDWDAAQTNDTRYVASLRSIQAAHADHFAWLMDKLRMIDRHADAKDDDDDALLTTTTLVMTHHPPIQGNNSCYYADFLQSLQDRICAVEEEDTVGDAATTGTTTDAEDAEDDAEDTEPPLPMCLKRYAHTWVCGHVHANVDDDTYGTKVFSCCHGYPSELREREEAPTPKMFRMPLLLPQV